MNPSRFSLLVGALVLAGAFLPIAAQAQAVCLTDAFGYSWDFQLSNNLLTGTADTGSGFDWYATGGRGTNSTTRRHHTLTAINPNLSNDPGCSDGGSWVDWFTYNGQVNSGGPNYAYSASWVNSCGNSGTITGTFTFGACPAPRQGEPPAGINPAMVAPEVGADARTTGQGYGLTSSPNPFTDGALIAYTLPARADVQVLVYDTLGRQVAVLVDESQEAGAHTVAFDAGTLPTGTYLYQIVAGTYTEAKQLVLVR